MIFLTAIFHLPWFYPFKVLLDEFSRTVLGRCNRICPSLVFCDWCKIMSPCERNYIDIPIYPCNMLDLLATKILQKYIHQSG
ncbi:hypothetical protein AAZX31_01G122500 [Glycine max]